MCPTCRKNKGEYTKELGYTACKSCQDLETVVSERTYEVIPDRVKEDRLAHKNSTIQPFRNGQVSKEYLDLYGSKHIEVTEDEVKNAKNVWGRDLGDYYKP